MKEGFIVMQKLGFVVAKDAQREGWFIYEVASRHVLNVNEVSEDEYKALFVSSMEPDTPFDTFETREDAEKVLNNINTIYVRK